MLDYPNREVSESFTKSLVAAFVNADISRVEYSVFQLTKNLKEGDVDGFCTALQTLFAHIPYQLHLPQEKYYHSLFQLLGTLLGLDIQSEIPTDKGRIDLVLFTERYIYIIEIKLDASAAKALQQIEEQKYYEKYRMSKKKIILIGISFKRKAKRLTLEWQSKEI
jgi:hypothetical protein